LSPVDHSPGLFSASLLQFQLFAAAPAGLRPAVLSPLISMMWQ
jgi:hypothetical protein